MTVSFNENNCALAALTKSNRRKLLLLHQKLNLSFQRDVMAMVLRNGIHHLPNCFYCRTQHCVCGIYEFIFMLLYIVSEELLLLVFWLMRRQGRPVTAMDCATELI